MLDPVTAAATATAAFNTIKKGFQIGRDIEQMAGDIGRWMSCLSDMEQAEKEAKNPPIFKKLFAGQSAEAEALQVFMANKKARQQREELKQFISWTLGQSAWDELIRMEGKIRKQRQETLYLQRERRRKFIEITAIVIFCAVVLGVILGFILLLKSQGHI
jgi:predicted small secreted protein|tara:strand:- start:344 stop:823 length:480 start_codon:yes stop_codon:yes gene_type:complete